jgi:hypothetical protein
LAEQDFGASGLRMGVYYSPNAAAVDALLKLAYFTSTAGTTQSALTHVLEDRAFVHAYIATNQQVTWGGPCVCICMYVCMYVSMSACSYMCMSVKV